MEMKGWSLDPQIYTLTSGYVSDLIQNAYTNTFYGTIYQNNERL